MRAEITIKGGLVLGGFEKIVEERIRSALKKGKFDDLPGSGKPLKFEDANVPADLKLAYKILKNADCIPPELELRKEIRQTEDLLANAHDEADKYRTLKKLNYLVMKLNSLRRGTVEFDVPQRYQSQVVEKLETHATDRGQQDDVKNEKGRITR